LILVCGATGQIGGLVSRKLLQRRLPVRALSRDISKLAELKSLGADVVQGDLMDRGSLDRALVGVERVFTSANSILGKGSTSPQRIDRIGNRNLVDAARAAGVRQFVFMSSLYLTPDASVDYFRIKVEAEEYIKRSGVPWVIVRSGALLDIWVPMLTSSMRKNGTATLFGPGAKVRNFIAGDDVAEYVCRILTRDDVINEVVEIGGPDNLAMRDLLGLAERTLGVQAKRRHIPLPVMRFMAPVVQAFNPVAARLMRLGYWSETVPEAFEGWRRAADRFGVEPMTVKEYLTRSKV